MSRKVASKAGLVGLVLFGGAVALSACSSSDDSSSPSGGTAGTSSGTAGKSGTAGTSSGTAGTSSGTAGTSSGTAGAGGSTGAGPFTCAGVAAACNSWTTFPQSTTNSWGSGTFTGGITIFGTGLTRDPAVTDGIHVTGMVNGYGFGFGLYFSSCADLSKYTGVSFKVKGTTNASGITLQVQSNADSPWQPRPQDMKGACTATDPTMAYDVCLPPQKAAPVTATETTVTVAWADLAGGMPTAGTDGSQVIGLQWALPWAGASDTAYAADVTVSDVTLTGGTGTTTCDTGAGTGGTGGTGAGGASGGSAGAATAGTGGASAGTGGTN